MGLWRYGECVTTQRGSMSENRRRRVARHDESSPEEPSKKWFSWQWSLCYVCCASVFSIREREREREREKCLEAEKMKENETETSEFFFFF